MRHVHTRALALVSSVLILAAAAACSDEDPVAPGIGFAESGTLTGTFTDTGTRVSNGVIANRSGQLSARMCNTQGANFDVLVTSGRSTDTVATGTSTEACETLQFDVVEGRTYRFRVKSVSGAGAWVICYAYDAATCQGLATFPADTGGVPQGYYLATEGKSGAELLAALHAVIRTGHNGFQYDSARGFLYQDVEDPNDDNLIEDLYAGRVITVDRRANSTTDATDANLNAEHAWPQSCGAGLDRISSGVRSTGPRGDLHIIYAADAPANNSRSNFPFGLISGNPESSYGPDSAGNFSRRGSNGTTTVFEPRAEKRGDIARALFYFYVRYVPEIPAQLSLENFNIEEATLLQWAQQDPVDAFEWARNNEVYAVQGNRNPFVDRPALLASIGDFPNTAAGAHAICDF